MVNLRWVRRASSQGGAAILGAAMVALGTTSCLPLPPFVEAALCPAQDTYVPDAVRSAPLVAIARTDSYTPVLIPRPNADIMARLVGWPGRIAVTPTPIVTVDLGFGMGVGDSISKTVAALRAEFGATIDIQTDSKRFGGGPSGWADACLLEAPRWAIASEVRKRITVEAALAAPTFRRQSGVTAAVFVTNHTRKAIQVRPDLVENNNSLCVDTLGEALSTTDSALAVNLAKGLDPTGHTTPSARNSNATFEWQGGRAAALWFRITCFHSGVTAEPVTLPPGESTAITVKASTSSLQPGTDPYVTAGDYDLRATIQIATSVATDAGFSTVAAPPVRVTLSD